MNNGFKSKKGGKFLNFAESQSKEGRGFLGSNTPDFKN